MPDSKPKQEVAAIVDDNGRLQAQFGGWGAEQDAQQHMDQCKGVDHLRGATIVTGDKAREAIEKKRL